MERRRQTYYLRRERGGRWTRPAGDHKKRQLQPQPPAVQGVTLYVHLYL